MMVLSRSKNAAVRAGSPPARVGVELVEELRVGGAGGGPLLVCTGEKNAALE